MCRQRAGCKAGTLTARSFVAAARGYAGKGQAATLEQQRLTARGRGGSCRTARGLGGIGRLECPNKRGLCAGKGQAAMLERWRPGAWWKLPRGICRQRAGCNPGAAKADGQRAWWKLPRGNWRVLGVLRVLSVWSLVTAGLNASMKDGYDKAGSTPPVVPGAAPALAKARVGGYFIYPGGSKKIPRWFPMAMWQFHAANSEAEGSSFHVVAQGETNSFATIIPASHAGGDHFRCCFDGDVSRCKETSPKKQDVDILDML